MSRSVAVLMGGPSAEHDVSLVSGRAIAAALAGRGHDVATWLITLDGAWWRVPPEPEGAMLPPAAYDDPAALGAEGPFGAAAALARLAGAGAAAGGVDRPARPVRRGRHGPGPVRGGRPRLHAGRAWPPRRWAWTSTLFKQLARGLELPVVAWRSLDAAAYRADPAGSLARLEAFAATLTDPRLMIKPDRLGSSVGMTIVRRPDEPPELEAALDEAFRYDDLVLAEAYLAGARELEVGLVGNGLADLAVFGPGEVFPGHEFYDYHAKYDPGVSRTTATPELRRAGPHDDPRAGRGGLPGGRGERLRARGLPVPRRADLPVGDQHHPRLHADQPLPPGLGHRRR